MPIAPELPEPDVPAVADELPVALPVLLDGALAELEPEPIVAFVSTHSAALAEREAVLPVAPAVPLVPVAPAVAEPPRSRHPVTVIVRLLELGVV